MSTSTPKAQLLDVLLRDEYGGLVAFLENRRAAGKSWRQITLDIRDITGVDVTHESLRAWIDNDPVAEAHG
jgi:hypothetical protein